MYVRVISRKALREFARAHQGAEAPLDDWYRTVKRLRWISLMDVRKTYPHADAVGEFTIFNIGGNKYRLAVYINYRTGKIYIRHVMTHGEYSREDWKKR
jgi:mRNA interferase HigB